MSGPAASRCGPSHRVKHPLLFLMVGLATIAPAFAADRPNIVFFLVDDLGQRDLGCYGSTFYETPHLDRLAREGALFTDAYASSPVCSPTRAAILTGRWPQRSGVTDFIGAAQPEKWKGNTKLLPAAYADRLARDEVTLAEMLKQDGYSTFFAGKWHLGPQGWWPEDQGFDINMGGVDRGGPYAGGKYFSPYDNPRLPDGPPGEHLPDRLARETAKFIEGHRGVPFLAFFSFYSVHTPLMARPDLQAKYEGKRKESGLENAWGREDTRQVRLVQEHAVYGGMVEAMDQAVGLVLAKLDELKLAENTIVIFTSDNGGLSTSEGSPTSNLPLRAGKGWLYEGGIRVPLIVRWPAVVAPGTKIDTPVSSVDFVPTLLHAAGAESPVPLDGLDLRPLLQGETVPERPLFWLYPHYGNQGGAPGAVVRLGDWKLIEWYEDGGRCELYNLREDVGEKHDLATLQPEKARDLAARLDAWVNEVGTGMPVTNPKFDPAKPNGRAEPGSKARGEVGTAPAAGH